MVMCSNVGELYKCYRTTLKPLVAEFESLEEQMIPSCLENLASMFDRVALLETSSDEAERHEHLRMASKHLDSAISDSREGVMANHIQTIDNFRQTYGKNTIETFKEGSFIGPFNSLDKEVHGAMAVDKVKAYEKLGAMVDMINDAHGSALVGNMAKEGRWETILKWVVTVLISLIVTILTT